MECKRIQSSDELYNTQSKRNRGIDLLRVISMFFIVLHHVISHGGVLKNTAQGCVNYYLLLFLEISILCAVNCFALISGYVGVISGFKLRRIISLWLRVAFYSVLLTSACMLIEGHFSLKSLILSFFPIVTGEYWFFSSYFLMMLFSPMMLSALNCLDEKKMRRLLGAIIVIVAVLSPIISRGGDSFYLQAGYSSLWLMILFLVGGYIKKFRLLRNTKSVFFLILYFGTNVLTLLLYVGTSSLFRGTGWENIWIRYSSITIFLSAIFLFLCFERLKVCKRHRLVSFIAPLVFSVYLIHDNPEFRDLFIADKFIWIFDYNEVISVLIVVCSALVIFIICISIDILRFYLFKLLKIESHIKNLEEKLTGRVTK